MTASADLLEGFAALNDAAPGYLRADNYATGTIPERFSSARIRALLQGSGDAYRFRLARKPITALTNRIGIGSIKSSAGDAVNARIEEIRRANDMAIQEPHLIERAATYGDAYWFVWEVEQDETEAVDGEKVDTPADLDLRAAGVEIAYQSPLHCRAMYDAEDGRRCRYVIRRWREAWPLGKVWRAEVWYADRLEAWHSDPDVDSPTDAEQWHPYAEDQDGTQLPASDENWPEQHDAGRIPFSHFRSDLPYGRPQHIDAYGPQDAITKAIVTQVEVDLEAHGWPERWKITDDKSVLDTARDTVDWLDDASAPKVADQVSGRRSGPGTEQVHTATKSVGEYTPPDPTLLIPVVDQWTRLMSVATDTPAWEFDPSTGQQMSGVARWRAEAPLRARERTFKRYLLQFLRETYELALHWSGMDAGDLEVEWTPQEVEADPEWWAVASAKRDQGVPQEQILTEAGYTPDQVADYLDASADERFWGERVRVLSELSTALNNLSGPVSLGIVDAAKVSALVDRIMRDAGESGIGGDGEADKPEPAPVIPVQPGAPVVVPE